MGLNSLIFRGTMPCWGKMMNDDAFDRRRGLVTGEPIPINCSVAAIKSWLEQFRFQSYSLLRKAELGKIVHKLCRER